MSNRIDHGGNVALRKVGNPDGFTVCGWEALDDGSVLYRMKQEIPATDTTRRYWIGEEKTACVNDDDLKAEVSRFEKETGRCAKCNGTGQQWQGWNHERGNRYEPCTRCGATGRARQ
jgi:hypothetical protein